MRGAQGQQPDLEALIRSGQGPDRQLVTQVSAGVHLGEDEERDRAQALAETTLGLGELTPYCALPAVTDVLVNGDARVWVDDGAGLRAAPAPLRPVLVGGQASVRRLAVRLAGLAGQRLDESQPYVDGQLPGGVRLHAVLPPLSAGGPQISLRLARRVPWRVHELAATGMLGPSALVLVRAIVEARLTFVVTGGTGSGKTTLLAALLGEVDPADRVLVIEDVGELAIAHRHVVHLQARRRNVEGVGEVTLVELVRQALRMRPDRIVVGEVRGPEVRELLSALNTGHEGGAGTLHANAVGDLPARLEALGALAGLSPRAMHAQARSALQVVLHVGRDDSGRHLQSVGVVDVEAGRATAGLEVRDAAMRVGGDLRPGSGWGLLRAMLESRGALPQALAGWVVP